VHVADGSVTGDDITDGGVTSDDVTGMSPLTVTAVWR
jgi:hypothetical protein